MARLQQVVYQVPWAEYDPDLVNPLSRFMRLPALYSVAITEGNEVTEYPGMRFVDDEIIETAIDGTGAFGKALWVGGYAYGDVSASEQTVLEAAGYTVS